MKINCKANCGNAPRKQLLKDLNIAFAKGEVQLILDMLTEDVQWEMVGDKVMNGKAEVAKDLESMKDYTAVEINIDHIITHGTDAACDGSFLMKNGDRFGFCDVYEFENNSKKAKIKNMISYAIGIK
ncbi:MAG: nuclear transport factor 2 family protein [Bacteroidota bacterium]